MQCGERERFRQAQDRKQHEDRAQLHRANLLEILQSANSQGRGLNEGWEGAAGGGARRERIKCLCPTPLFVPIN
eukprot:2468197-Rhodomonas_salina.1